MWHPDKFINYTEANDDYRNAALKKFKKTDLTEKECGDLFTEMFQEINNAFDALKKD